MMEFQPMFCHTPESTYRDLNIFGSVVKATFSPPMSTIRLLIMPVEVENMALMMLTSTTADRKCGA